MGSNSSLLPKVEIDKPHSSNHDLGSVKRFSAGPGYLYPVHTLLVAPGDRVKLNISSMIKTLPLLGPMMGSFKVQFDTFFVPFRLYHRSLHDNRTDFDPSSILFPYFQLTAVYPPPVGGYTSISTDSVWHFLGVPQRFTYYPSPSVPLYTRNFNAVPLLGYWDIFRGYYANTQETVFPMTVHGVSGNVIDATVPLQAINTVRDNIMSAPSHVAYQVLPMLQNITGEMGIHGSCCGLLRKTLLPDRFNVWVNSTSYASTISSSRVSVTSGSFSVDDLRFANKLNSMLQKTLVSGGRFSDWQTVQYGVSPSSANEIPRFVSTASTELVFEDIVQTSSSTSENPLGTLGARGLGYLKPRSHRFHATEHGLLMTIFSITPRVDYYQGVFWPLNLTNYGQLHVPALDGIGFQDLLEDELYSGNTPVSSLGVPTLSTAIGKQPAWSQYMTDVNRLHGDFADPNKLMYLVLARRFSGTSTGYTTYIQPVDYNYIFADSSSTAQNFWIQARFHVHVKRKISKRVMPHL